jgi:hypothetical protein
VPNPQNATNIATIVTSDSGEDTHIPLNSTTIIGSAEGEYYVSISGGRKFEITDTRTLLTGAGFDAWQVNPHLVPVADGAFSVGNYTERIHNFYIMGNIKGSLAVTLTESVPTQVYAIVIPAGERCGGWLEYSIWATDGVDYQLFTSRVPFSAVNKGGTISAAFTPASPSNANDGNAGVVSAGGMSYGLSLTTTATELRFFINAATTLVQTQLVAEVAIRMMRPQLTSPE